jgi:hypothetical protein
VPCVCQASALPLSSSPVLMNQTHSHLSK